MKRILLVVLSVIMIACLSSCGISKKEAATIATTHSESTTETTTVEETAKYQEISLEDVYNTALYFVPAYEGLNKDYADNIKNIYYAIKDINNDGNSELIFNVNVEEALGDEISGTDISAVFSRTEKGFTPLFTKGYYYQTTVSTDGYIIETSGSLLAYSIEESRFIDLKDAKLSDDPFSDEIFTRREEVRKENGISTEDVIFDYHLLDLNKIRAHDKYGLIAEIAVAYREAIDNIVYTNGAKTEYALFDFDGDSISELLVWDERFGTAMDRNITVYSYNQSSKEVENIGNIVVFEGHSTYWISASGNSFFTARMFDDDDTINEYLYEDGKIICNIRAERNGETDRYWKNIVYDGEFYNSEYILWYTEDWGLFDIIK